MLKATAILLIVCFCAGLGLTAAHRLRQCERRWRAWEQLLQRLRGMLAYSAEPIQVLLAAVPKEDLQALPWLAHYDERQTALTVPATDDPEEEVFARSVFRSFGTTDLEGQLALLEQAAFRAAEHRRTAEDRAARSAKAYAATGVCAGLSIGLLLI